VNHIETQSKLYYNQPTNVWLNRFLSRLFDGLLIQLVFLVLNQIL